MKKTLIAVSLLFVTGQAAAQGLPPVDGSDDRGLAPGHETAVNISAPIKENGFSEHLAQSVDMQSMLKQVDNHSSFSNLVNDARVLSSTSGCQSMNASGQTLIDRVFNQNSPCTYPVFNENIVSNSGFTTIADEMLRRIANYDHTSSSQNLENGFLYLRGAIYYKASRNYPISSTYESKGKQVIDAMLNHRDMASTTEAHAKNTYELMVMVNNLRAHRDTYDAVMDYFKDLTYNHVQSKQFTKNANQIAIFLYNGFVDTSSDNIKDLVLNDRQFFDKGVALTEHSVPSEHAYFLNNVASEVSRYAASSELHVKDAISDLLRHSYSSDKAAIRLKASANIEYYGDCADYNICGWKEDAVGYMLPTNHDCSSTIKIRAQDMNRSELDWACAQLADEENIFHRMLNTGRTPVADDLNNQLEIVVWDSSADYKSFSGVFFNHDTNNGGMYLEGNPDVPGNVARFLAHERSWDRSEFAIWNLRHEYVHYLDGRFDLHGNFMDGYNKDTVWWTEGLAEYVSTLNKNEAAKTLIDSGSRRSLYSTMNQGYSAGQDAVYRWGYLVVRYMFEKHPDEVQGLLNLWRYGDYNQAKTEIDRIARAHYRDFDDWIRNDFVSDDSIPDGLDTTTPPPPPPPPPTGNELENNRAISVSGTSRSETDYFIEVPSNVSTVTFEISGGNGDADMYAKAGAKAETHSGGNDCSSRNHGNTDSCTINTNGHSIIWVMLEAYHAYSGVSLKATIN